MIRGPVGLIKAAGSRGCDSRSRGRILTVLLVSEQIGTLIRRLSQRIEGV